jgi:hypothetical protein
LSSEAIFSPDCRNCISKWIQDEVDRIKKRGKGDHVYDNAFRVIWKKIVDRAQPDDCLHEEGNI